MHEYRMEHLFSCTVDLKNPPETIGPTPDGLRINFYIAGGVVTGQKISGRFLPVGADWAIMRTDGVGVLDIRATIETIDGALPGVPCFQKGTRFALIAIASQHARVRSLEWGGGGSGQDSSLGEGLY